MALSRIHKAVDGAAEKLAGLRNTRSLCMDRHTVDTRARMSQFFLSDCDVSNESVGSGRSQSEERSRIAFLASRSNPPAPQPDSPVHSSASMIPMRLSSRMRSSSRIERPPACASD